MARLGGTGAARKTPAEAKAEKLRQAAAASNQAPARRGEEDGPTAEPASPTLVPVQSARAVEPTADAVVLSSEGRSLQYIPPPADADDRDRIAHHRRSIVLANTSLVAEMGRLERDYVLSAGRHLWEATQDNKVLKAAGYKGVDAFAESVGLSKQDVYRLRRAVPVYRVIGDMVETPLNERTVRELYGTLTDGKDYAPTPEREQHLRDQFAEMKRAGKVTASGAAWARDLLQLGAATPVIEIEGVDEPVSRESLRKLESALKARRIIDIDTLKEAKDADPDAVQRYVDQLRDSYEKAAALLEG